MRHEYNPPWVGGFEELRWRFPDFWMLALSALAWVVLAARAGTHVHQPGAATNWWHWMLMVAAMMLPLQIDGVRLTAEHSLWSRRHRSIAGYLFGYLSVWALAGVPLSWAFMVLEIPRRIDWMLGSAIGFLIAAAWLVSPWKPLAARMCHRALPLSPTGWKADRDCLAYGWIAGCGGAFNCWPLMLVCWLSGHSFIAMIFGFGLGWADRHSAQNYKLDAVVAVVLSVAFALGSQAR
jgi:Predicted metal-binding integral membrane protein (DUF2182)